MLKTAATPLADRGRTVWRMRLQSAFRTAVACTVVGCTTLYGPEILRKHITFPAFSYVTAILIVSDGYLGHTMRGCFHAFYATIQVVPIAMLSIRIIGLSRFFPFVAAVAVALISFVVALPESTPLLAKRIAFGQLVIVYVDAVNHREDDLARFHATGHPLHVAASTALGAISALLAMLLPFPRLAYFEVRKLCRLYAENAAQRMNLYLQALTTEGRTSAAKLISRAKPFDEVSKKLLQTITLIQGGILWEMPWMRFSKPEHLSPGNRLQALETPMKGMEIALQHKPPLPAGLAAEDMDNHLLGVSTLLNLKAEQARCFLPFNSTTVPECQIDSIDKINLPYETILSIHQDQSASFLLSCAQQFIDDSKATQIPATPDVSVHSRKQLKYQKETTSPGFKEFWSSWTSNLRKERFIFSIKCALSLGLAVQTGLLFNKANGYWSGLTIAISFSERRQAVFTMANARAQGTAIGSVYGVLGCFVFTKFPEIRFLALFPWILFTSFLMHSRMYGQAGGTSAVIGALLILGRKNYGLPDEFAIARLTEAIIGLCCFVLVEFLFQPKRASTLAKKQLHLSLLTLQRCIEQVALLTTGDSQPSSRLQAYKESKRNLNSQVQDLENLIAEAEIEPNFSFFPFPGSRYKKVNHSLKEMADLMSCMSYSLEYLLQVSCDHIAPRKEIQEYMHKDWELCKATLDSLLNCLEEASQIPPDKTCHDEEKGNLQIQKMSSIWNTEVIQTTGSSSFLQQSKEVRDRVNDIEVDDEMKGKILVSLSAMGFCSSYIIQETKSIQRVVEQLIYWEHPSNQQ